MAVGRTASLLVFFLILSQGFALACDPNEKCRSNDPDCEARKQACKALVGAPSTGAGYKRHRYRIDPGFSVETAPDGSASEPKIVGGAPRSKIKASRLFVAPHDFPPEEYAAYGIVAFPTLSTPETKDRYRLVCQAYWATLPQSSDLDTPISQQMVTVWPVDNPKSPMLGNDMAEACKYAVEHYDLKTGLTALKEAADADIEALNGVGPYLLAWSPARAKGEKDTIVLALDLSSATTSQNFIEQFQAWREKIEGDPTLWHRGFNPDRLRIAIKYWVDRWGSAFLSASFK